MLLIYIEILELQVQLAFFIQMLTQPMANLEKTLGDYIFQVGKSKFKQLGPLAECLEWFLADFPPNLHP